MGAIKITASVSGAAETIAWLDGGAGIIEGEVGSWLVGTSVHYAVYVEFGTSKMAAQPFLYPAARKAMANTIAMWDSVGDVNSLIKELAKSSWNQTSRS